MTTIKWELPIKTVSEANTSEHWTKKARRHKAQQWVVRLAFGGLKSPISLPCCVKMTRVGGGQLDTGDNLPMAFKYIKDQIAEEIFPETAGYYTTKGRQYVDKHGRTRTRKAQIRSKKGNADDDPRITWEYAQEKAKKHAVRIEITYDA